MSQRDRQIRRQQAQGATYKSLCAKYGLTRSELTAILREPVREKLSEERQLERAIEELRSEGHGEDVIRANFGIED